MLKLRLKELNVREMENGNGYWKNEFEAYRLAQKARIKWNYQ